MKQASTSTITGTPQNIATASPAQVITPGRAAAAASAIAAILYLLTMSSTFGFIDEGELAAVASTLGIAHPTGYPTFTLLGHLFTLMLPVHDILALNIMAALLVAASVGVMTLLFADIMERMFSPARQASGGKTRGAGKKAKTSPRTAILTTGGRVSIAACAALAIGFTSTWWEQATGVEVYAIHALMLPLVSLLFLRYMEQEEEREAVGRENAGKIGFTRRGVLFAFVLGLSFTNHLTTIYLAPAFLVHYFWTLGFGGWRDGHPGQAKRSGFDMRSLVRLLYLAPGFLAGLLPYLWLPLRASAEPRFNWGNPQTLENFLHHVTGQVFQVYMFGSTTAFGERSTYFFGGLPGELVYLGFAVAIAGCVTLALRRRRLFVWSALIFLGCILWAGNYDIMEIAPYYMAAMLAAGIWCAAGFEWLAERFGEMPAIIVAAAVAAGGCALHYSANDERPNTLVEDMTVNMLTALPEHAIIFSSQWDFWVAGSYYLQGVEGIRPDVMVIDQELLRRTWYLDELTANHPDFMKRVEPEVARFWTAVRPFEQGEPYNGTMIQAAYIGMIDAMIDRNIGERPVLVTPEVDREMGSRYIRVPSHLAYRLTTDTSYLPQEFPAYRFTPWPGRMDIYTSKIHELYAITLANRMAYEERHGNDSLALRYRDYALSFDPGWAADMVPDLPRDGEEHVLGMIQLFDRLKRTETR